MAMRSYEEPTSTFQESCQPQNASITFRFLCRTATKIYVYHQMENLLNHHAGIVQIYFNKDIFQALHLV